MGDGTAAPRLSAAIITYNEASNLPRLLEALRGVADEVVVLDSGSTDGTIELARDAGARVVVTDWPGYGRQKQRALELCRGEWVVSIDADEVPDEQLRLALAALPPAADSSFDGFRVDRLTEYQGGWVKHAWSPDWLTRVVKSHRARFTDCVVHEKLRVDGPVGRLPGRLLHYSYVGLEDHYRRMVAYARLGAEQMEIQGRSFRADQLITHPLGAFLRLYVLKQGFRDGLRGLLVSGGVACQTFFKYAFLYERQRRHSHVEEEKPAPSMALESAAERSDA